MTFFTPLVWEKHFSILKMVQPRSLGTTSCHSRIHFFCSNTITTFQGRKFNLRTIFKLQLRLREVPTDTLTTTADASGKINWLVKPSDFGIEFFQREVFELSGKPHRLDQPQTSARQELSSKCFESRWPFRSLSQVWCWTLRSPVSDDHGIVPRRQETMLCVEGVPCDSTLRDPMSHSHISHHTSRSANCQAQAGLARAAKNNWWTDRFKVEGTISAWLAVLQNIGAWCNSFQN